MILSTLVTSQLHFEMCARLYGHPVYLEKFISTHTISISRYTTARPVFKLPVLQTNSIA